MSNEYLHSQSEHPLWQHCPALPSPNKVFSASRPKILINSTSSTFPFCEPSVDINTEGNRLRTILDVFATTLLLGIALTVQGMFVSTILHDRKRP
jgi:hypothetical protein